MRVGRYLDLVAAFDSTVMHDTSGGKAGQQYTPAGDWIRKRDYDSLVELKQSEKDKEAQARAEQRNTVKKWAITLGIGLGISLIALIMAIFGFVRVRLAVRSRDAMYVHDIPQIGPVSVARIVDYGTGTKTWLRSSPDRGHPALAGSQGPQSPYIPGRRACMGASS